MTSPPLLQLGVFYHIYNRGTNREDIFAQERNYRYFLQLYTKHVEPAAEMYAYCLRAPWRRCRNRVRIGVFAPRCQRLTR